jgi:hypothetical protein
MPVFAEEGGDGGAVRRDERGRPIAADRTSDRKLVPRFDLVSNYPAPPRVVASKRFVRALREERVPGWHASLVPHVTPNAVSGHRAYYLSFDGWIRPFVDTKLEFGVPNPGFPEEQPNGIAFDPVTFDATRGTGHTIAWSSWCGIRESEWRALVCRGSLFRRLSSRLGGVRFGVTRVDVRGWRDGGWSEPGVIESDDARPPIPWKPDAVVDRVRTGASHYAHEAGDVTVPWTRSKGCFAISG